jgi:sialic acid synthase SpsE
MSKIILDFGSANSCHNDKAYIKRMYDELKAVDTGKHEVVIKWQLFERAGDNLPLTHETFQYAYDYGTKLGYKVTSSVFDKNSLDFLLRFDPCFVKIANRRDLDWLIGEVPRKVSVYVSIGEYHGEKMKAIEYGIDDTYLGNVTPICCVSNYPTTVDHYEEIFGRDVLKAAYGISDHTTNFGLWYRYKPEIIEWHYKLPDSTGLDAGPFARTPAQLAEIL